VASSSPAQILETAMLSFVDAYQAVCVGKSPGVTMGPEAIEKSASTIRQRELPETGLRHLEHFVLALGVRRALAVHDRAKLSGGCTQETFWSVGVEPGYGVYPKD
jgi:hypothetical protein